MGKLIAWNLVTLDGFFEGTAPWDLAFHEKAWGEELDRLSTELGSKAHALVFGRKTYEGMKSYWTTAQPSPVASYMNSLPKLVASRAITSSDWNNTTVTADIVSEVERLKHRWEKDLYLFGSAELLHDLLEAGVVDEVMLCIVPVLLGEGTPLFKPGIKADLNQIDVQVLEKGGVIARYQPLPPKS
jgi:dihydrofolate reductase